MRFISKRFAAIWLPGFAAALLVLILTSLFSTQVDRLNTLVFDTYERIKPRQWAGSDVVVIDIDETSLKQIGQWPWPRTIVAELTDRLGELGAAAIVFDVIFPEADRTSPLRAIDSLRKAGARVEVADDTSRLDNDKVLAESFKRNLVVTALVLDPNGTTDPPLPKAGHGFSGTQPDHYMPQGMKAVRNIPILDDAASGIGEITYPPSGDGVVRRSTLLAPANGRFYPNLAMETLRVVQGAGGFKIKSSDGSGEAGGGELAIVAVQVGALSVPTDAQGALKIYHSSAAEKPVVSAASVLNPENAGSIPVDLRDAIANHIVLIGTSAQGLLDLRTTPLDPVVPGVLIHADMIDQIVSGTYLSRPDLALGIEILVAVLAVLLLITVLPLLRSLGDAFMTVFLVIAIIGGFWIAFSQYQLLLSPIIPVFSILAAYGIGSAVHLVVTEREGRFIRQAFGHYLAPSLVEKLAENPAQLTLGGEEKELTLLFCDIRGFTSLSEGLGPTELTSLLNDFLTPMTTVLLERGATIDKYMGDAIMAFWNAPIAQEDHCQLACLALLDMREALQDLNQHLPKPIDIGIGLNTGPSCVGNLGSTQRFNYSAIGDAVNVASRVEGLTKQYGVDNLVVEQTALATANLAFLEVDLVSVVGRDEPIRILTLLGNKETMDVGSYAELNHTHSEMLSAYRAGNLAEAETLLAALRKHDWPMLKKLYDVYEGRISTLREVGVPKSWDGVFRASQK